LVGIWHFQASGLVDDRLSWVHKYRYCMYDLSLPGLEGISLQGGGLFCHVGIFGGAADAFGVELLISNVFGASCLSSVVLLMFLFFSCSSLSGKALFGSIGTKSSWSSWISKITFRNVRIFCKWGTYSYKLVCPGFCF
jgi:hypothetical protein